MLDAYLIDPELRTVTLVNAPLEDHREIYRLIGNGCNCFDAVYLNEHLDAIFVDDDGLRRPGLRSFGVMAYRHTPVLYGRGVVLGADANRDPCAPRISIEMLRLRIIWTPYVTRGDRS